MSLPYLQEVINKPLLVYRLIANGLASRFQLVVAPLRADLYEEYVRYLERDIGR